MLSEEHFANYGYWDKGVGFLQVYIYQEYIHAPVDGLILG